MAARRPHPKSKLGCADCKRRRIKCDEGRPECANCQRRGIRCSFQTFDPAPQPGISATADTGTAREKNVPMIHVFSTHELSGTNSPFSGGTLEQEEIQDELLKGLPAHDRPTMKSVLNHFANETIQTVSPGRAAHAAWREALPPLATQYLFVLHGMLAVGCLHVSTAAGLASEKDNYLDIAATQMNLGMAQYYTEVQKVTTGNAEALFAFSTMVTTFVLFTTATEFKETLASIRGCEASIEYRKETISTMANLICRTFRSMRGVLVILVPCYHHIQSGKLQPMLERDWWPAPIVVTVEDVETDKKLRRLELMWSQPGKTYEYSFDALRSALKDLRENFAVVSRLADMTFPGDAPDECTFDWTAVLHWPVQLSLDFVSLLELRRMEAWVLMAHFAMLPAKATDNPWLDGLAPNIVTTTALVIGEENWEWIAWPASVLKVDLEKLRIKDTTSRDSDSTRDFFAVLHVHIPQLLAESPPNINT